VLVRLDHISHENLQRLLRSAYDAVSSGSVNPGRQRGTRRQKASRKKVGKHSR
jgi:hypothetical protein